MKKLISVMIDTAHYEPIPWGRSSMLDMLATPKGNI
jgi:hypothetical protein